MVDNKTSHLALPLPDLSNMQDEDVPRIGQALRLIDAHVQGVDAHAQAAEAVLKEHDEKLQLLGGSAQAESARVDLLEQAREKETVDRAAADREAAARIDTLADEQAAVALRVNALGESSAEQGERLSSVESGITSLSTMLIGTLFPHTCADNYVPNGCVPANGGEYTRAQFPSLFDDYLVGGKLQTCSYAAWAAQVGITGNYTKFALDTVNQKFRVPLLKDGDSITQASSAAELGKSYKAGLPDIQGTIGATEYLSNYPTGALYATGASVNAVVSSTGTRTNANMGLKASLYNSIYGNSTTVVDEQVRLRHFVVVASAQNSASVFDWSNYMGALAGKANTDLSNATGNALGYYFYAYDQKPSGTSGGTTSAATWMTRDINTVARNFIGASLASNRITLPAGRYRVMADVPAFAVNSYRASLYDVTHGAHLLYSPSCECNNGYGYTIPAHIDDEITLTTTTALELRMYCEVGRGDGLGIAGGFGLPERYTEVRIWKM